MAREASSLTKAIRSLCDETNFEITHGQARPRLKEMGFDIAPEPNEKMSEDVSAFEAAFKVACENHNFDADNPEHVKQLRGIAGKTLGWNDHKVRIVSREIDNRRSFHNERNSFDVSKYNYKKLKESRAATPSRKPADKPTPAPARQPRKTARPNVVKGPKPKHQPAAPARTHTSGEEYAAEVAALQFVEDNGGIAGVMEQKETLEQQKAALEAQIADLDAKLELVQRLADRVKKNAA